MRYGRVDSACADDPGVDAVLFHTGFSYERIGSNALDASQQLAASAATLVRVSERSGKPVVVALRAPTTGWGFEQTLEYQQHCWRAGLATYPSVERAGASLGRLLRWQALRD